jgi:hypothetical protein
MLATAGVPNRFGVERAVGSAVIVGHGLQPFVGRSAGDTFRGQLCVVARCGIVGTASNCFR